MLEVCCLVENDCFNSSTYRVGHVCPVNIRNVFKWFKHLQDVFKTYLNPILWFSKRFKVDVYTVMFKKRFINFLYTNLFTENISWNVYKITKQARFDWKCFLNIYKIAEEMKVMLEMLFKHSS